MIYIACISSGHEATNKSISHQYMEETPISWM